MSSKSTFKILVAGIGGVGGYFGGRLSQYYERSNEVEVYFLSRSHQLNAIAENGLKVQHNEETFIAFPHKVSGNPDDFGEVDVVLLCTKNYGLQDVLKQLENCISHKTTIIPLMNGIEAYDKIQSQFSYANVTRACVYVVARRQEPGLVVSSGQLQKIYFGPGNRDVDSSIMVESKIKEAAIDISYRHDIISLAWEKFLFISPLATATSFFDCSIGALLEDAGRKKILLQLIDEIHSLAAALTINLPADTIDRILERMHSLPYQNTSSMHIDFQQKKGITELASLTGYVVRLGDQELIETPTYDSLYQSLLER